MLPIGWYVVEFKDTLVEVLENGQVEKSAESFSENVLVLENEHKIFKDFISNFNSRFKAEIWEHDEFNLDEATKRAEKILETNFPDVKINKAVTLKIIQLARHLGHNNDMPPAYYTFEQKNGTNIRKYVEYVREKDLGKNATEEYLQSEYRNSDNSFFEVLFQDFEDFYRAYEYEDNVYRKSRKGTAQISEGSQEIKGKRLPPLEVRKQVFSRDGHQCACCGKSSNLEPDHTISFKIEAPKDDNPNLYQTLCGTCNREKWANSFNYRITNFNKNSFKVKDVLRASEDESPIYYLTRLINCYYATNAVQKNHVQAVNHGSSIWRVKVKQGANPEENILKLKEELIHIIESKGYKLKDLVIETL